MRAAWLLAGLLALLPAPAAAAGVERFREYLRSTQTAQVDFEQQVFERDRKLVQRSRGSFTLQRPGRFRRSYAQPYAQLIVGDGKRVWIYDEDLNQGTVRAMTKALGSSPAALLSGAADGERAFELSDAGTREGPLRLLVQRREYAAAWDTLQRQGHRLAAGERAVLAATLALRLDHQAAVAAHLDAAATPAALEGFAQALRAEAWIRLERWDDARRAATAASATPLPQEMAPAASHRGQRLLRPRRPDAFAGARPSPW